MWDGVRQRPSSRNDKKISQILKRLFHLFLGDRPHRAHLLRGVAARAEGHDDVHEEEGEPADDEGANHDAHRLGGLPLLGQRDLGLLVDEAVDLLEKKRKRK